MPVLIRMPTHSISVILLTCLVLPVQEITTMEEELKTKSELIAKHKKLIEGWRKELKEQLGKHITELERV